VKEEMEELPILRVTGLDRSEIEDTVVREFPFTIILNNHEVATLLCSPTDLEHLAVGFLLSEGLLESKDEIGKITVDAQRGVVRVEAENGKRLPGQLPSRRIITSGGGRGTSQYSAADTRGQAKAESQVAVSAQEVFSLVSKFEHSSQVYKATGGVHSAALCDTKRILVFSEDIGRHNAIDKIFGECILKDIPTDDRMVITSGRVSSEILLKVARRNVPVIISVSAPTNLAVRLANDLGVTLIGFVRGKRMNVYANGWRVETG